MTSSLLSAEQSQILKELEDMAELVVQLCNQKDGNVDRSAILRMLRSTPNGSGQIIGFQGVKGGDVLVAVFNKQPFVLNEFVFPRPKTVTAGAEA